MDFEIAERKLKSEQLKLRSKHRARRGTNTNTSNTTNKTRRYVPALSHAAQKQAEEQKKLNEKRLKEAEKKRKVKSGMEQYVKSCERLLGVSTFGAGAIDGVSDDTKTSRPTITSRIPKTNTNLKFDSNKLFLKGKKFTPTSIWGEGDKITLPPSVLSLLAEKDNGGGFGSVNGSPITFRVGILNPNYSEFPSSESMKKKMEELTLKYSHETNDDEHDSDEDMEDEEEDENSNDEAEFTKAYREELSHRYISYTHATVVEFTQEDGHIGLPSPIASALLDFNNTHDEKEEGKKKDCVVPTTRTVDPSSTKSSTTSINMDIDKEEEEKTPGHLAWGAFDIPDTEIEILMVKLPKGKRCTLIPTEEAVKNGFYGLKDVKLVLEQSLIRTRATLSLNDIVHTWHRGVKFDLKVSAVEPSEFSAVSCINTDIEVDIGLPEGMKNETTNDEKMGNGTAAKESQKEEEEEKETNGFAAAGTGRSLMDLPPRSITTTTTKQPLSTPSIELPPEPPTSQTSNTCTIQIRNERGQNVGRRRFDTTQNTLFHLFAFAASALEEDLMLFHLATRFPRSVFSLDEEKKEKTLEECGIIEGQMMFFVERGV